MHNFEHVSQYDSNLLKRVQVFHMQSLPPTLPSSMQQGGVGTKGALIDTEGFPRADIDLYVVRTARNKIICEYGLLNVHLQNE